MVEVRPFRALRYAGLPPERMGEVSSPPYDVFSPEMQRAYHARHPHNIVRLIQGEFLAGEQDDGPRIRRATAYLARWREEGVLAFDPRPALFPYRQSFTLPDGRRLERRGFFAKIRLARYDEEQIHPHEQTFPKPKGYLFDLWGRCEAHLEPIFGFYDDASDAALSALVPSMAGAPLADFEDEGVRHALWRCEDPSALRAAQEALAARQVFIADGHHRDETALNLREAARAQGAPAGGEADYTLMCLANAADPGMVILPTHRLLKKVGAGTAEALGRLQGGYEVIEEPAPREGEGTQAALRLQALGKGGRAAFALYDGQGPVRYLLRKGGGAAGGAVEEALASLDVRRLHEEVIEGAFRASHEEADLGFTPDPEAALAAARRGECAAALLLNPTPIEA
ncbi:MAG: DUF1015 domain-containing protein, partial [Candidatus Tectomicrobia bacterium]|nr:DUF1015 domain-containing protein [Candidatus Tectomicrobia bacterium]